MCVCVCACACVCVCVVNNNLRGLDYSRGLLLSMPTNKVEFL